MQLHLKSLKQLKTLAFGLMYEAPKSLQKDIWKTRLTFLMTKLSLKLRKSAQIKMLR